MMLGNAKRAHLTFAVANAFSNVLILQVRGGVHTAFRRTDENLIPS
jgi:hypothetical protein